MPKSLLPYYKAELALYQDQYRKGDFKKAWGYLERAHVIGQKYPYAHSYVHWKMFLFGIKIKDTKEIIGQIPVGNTGGANISPLKPLPVKEDIQEIFIKAGI